ncbi:MAG TPA: alpha/beta hydrolase [Pantoea sp.]|nr:alpha/beta hydrolase [Pantoea sp.]
MKMNKLTLAAGMLLAIAGGAAQAQAQPINNIVLVHGAFVGGAGWRPVYDRLTHDGYKVTLVQEPLTGFPEDVAATRRIIDQQNGPVILVGHSYGGAIISEAGNDNKVAGLVYIAAHALDNGETEASNGKKFPNSAHPFAKSSDGYLTIAPENYHSDFAADLPTAQADFEAHAQMPTNSAVFTANIPDPAWKTKPSWYMVAKADKIISPDLERMYAKRAHSHTVEIAGASHSVYQSHPDDVAKLIEQAALHAQP